MVRKILGCKTPNQMWKGNIWFALFRP